MSQQIHKIKERIHHRFKAGHHRGFGIHSPYLYRLITAVLEEKWPYYHYACVEHLRKELKTDHASIDNDTEKRGSNRLEKTEARCGQLLFRLIQDAHCKTVLELGTSTGLETQYMAFANQKARCISVTTSAEIAALALEGFKKQDLKNIELHLLQNDETPEKILNELGTLDFVLFNQFSGEKECLILFEQCLLKKNKDSLFVFTNIHSNPDILNTWKIIRTHSEVQVTIDLYHLGIVIFNTALEKKKYVIQIK